MMTPGIDAHLPPVLRQLPYLVVELASDGTIRAANPRFADLVGGSIQRSIHAYLDEASAEKYGKMLRSDAHGPNARPWELNLVTPAGIETHAFHLVRDAEEGTERFWLIERPRDVAMDDLHEELTSANSQLIATQRELAKKTNRLSRALDEIERKLSENEILSQQLQYQNEEVEAQNEELLAMTEELHHGQDELLQLNQQLERKTRELQIALSGRNRFYASMSHELRTPVNAIMGYNDLLLAGVYGDLNEQQELAVERSQKVVRHLRELVNDVLDISKLEAGKLDLELEPVDLRELLEDLLATIEPMAQAQGSSLHLSLDMTPGTIRTDPRRLRQILLNLLSNGIKFGGGKPIWVRCSTTQLGGVLIEVVDNGPGIAPTDMGSIFDEFTQFAGSEHAGTGLGLSIARRLSRLLGGDLDAASTLEVGSTFRLRLPRNPPEIALDATPGAT